MKLSELAKRVGKSGAYVLVLQKKFGLPVCKNYPDGYAVLLEKLVYPWAFPARKKSGG